MLTFKLQVKIDEIRRTKAKVNNELHRLELEVEGTIAFIEYELDRDTLILIHTEVPAALEGKGAGSAIVQKALQYAKDNNYKIVPICPFVQSYLKRHKEWRDIIVPAAQKLFNGH